MPTKNHHDKPFDEGTLVKLEIFEEYAQEWIPTFVMSGFKILWIFDFFAGPGYDLSGREGSPIRLLNKVKEQLDNIKDKGVKVHLYFNEYDKKKYSELQQALEKYLEENKDLSNYVKLRVEKKDFDICFFEELENIKKHPSLLYLDQNGLKFLKDKYFNEFLKMKQTDFLYFAASSYLKKYGKAKEMQGIIDTQKIIVANIKESHRILVEEMRKKIPPHSEIKLYPFTLKKSTGHYGIMFGGSHPRAFDKFINVAWEMNPTNGEANYDIDGDETGQVDLFTEKPKTTKKEAFNEKLKKLVLEGELRTNKSVLDFCYEEGHPSKHGQECLKELKKDKKINYERSSPLVNYDQVYKNKKTINYEIL